MDIQLEVGASGDGLLDKLTKVREQLQGVAKEAAEAGKANQQAAQASIIAADTWITKEQELMASIRKQNEEMRAQAKLLQEMKAKYDELRAASAKGLDPAAVSKYNDQIKALKKEIDGLKAQLNSTTGKKIEIFAPGSVDEARATVARLRSELDGLSRDARRSKTGQYLKAEFELAKKELAETTKEVENNAKASGALNKAWGFLRQAAYVIPGLGIAGIIGLITDAVMDLVKQFNAAEEAQKVFKNISAEASKSVADEKIKLETLVNVVRDHASSKDAVKNAVKGINDLMPEYNGNISEEDIKTGKVNKTIEEYIKAITAKARGQAFVAKIQAKQAELIDMESAALENSVKWYERILNVVRGGGVTQGAILDQQSGALNRAKAQKEIDDLMDVLEKEVAAGTARLDDEQTKTAKKITEKRLQEFKDRSDQILALEKQLLDARIAAMQDGRQKEIAIEEARYDDQVARAVNAARKAQEEIEKVQGSNKSKADKEREISELATIIARNNEVIEQENLTHTARLLAIDLKYYDDAKKALEESQAAITDLVSRGQDKEIIALEAKYQKLFKAIEDARKKALQAVDSPEGQTAINDQYYSQLSQLTEQKEKDRLNIVKKYALQRIAEDEKLATAEAGIIQKAGANATQLERIRQAAVLQVQIEAAEARIRLLESSNEKEDKLIVAQAKATIEKAKLELQKIAGKNRKDFSIYSLLGLDLSPQEQRDVEMGARAITDSILSIWRSYVDARVQEQERLMQKLQDDISKQESIVDQEKALKEKGYANDYDIEQRKLDDMKRRSNEQNEMLKKAQKEQMEYAKAQQIIQGIVSATKLGAAAAEYILGSAPYGPFVGPLLAAGAIATLFAAFAAAKTEAKQVSNFTTYRSGGEFDATGNYPTHEQGGIDIMVGGKKKGEFEQGEYAYIFQDGPYAKQFKPFFEAINKRQMSDWKISRTGLELPKDTVQNIIIKHEAVHSPGISSSNSEKHLASMDRNLKKLAAPKKNVEYRDGYRIETTGNHVRKIRIRKNAE